VIRSLSLTIGNRLHGKDSERPRYPKGSDEDIVRIDFLIKKGVADPNNIGILGQSHGAWLGPCVWHITGSSRLLLCRGSGNLATKLCANAGWSNLNVHEYYYDGSPYDNPRRYLELSPVFSFKGMTTATLLEYGRKVLQCRFRIAVGIVASGRAPRWYILKQVIHLFADADA